MIKFEESDQKMWDQTLVELQAAESIFNDLHSVPKELKGLLHEEKLKLVRKACVEIHQKRSQLVAKYVRQRR